MQLVHCTKQSIMREIQSQSQSQMGVTNVMGSDGGLSKDGLSKNGGLSQQGLSQEGMGNGIDSGYGRGTKSPGGTDSNPPTGLNTRANPHLPSEPPVPFFIRSEYNNPSLQQPSSLMSKHDPLQSQSQSQSRIHSLTSNQGSADADADTNHSMVGHGLVGVEVGGDMFDGRGHGLGNGLGGGDDHTVFAMRSSSTIAAKQPPAAPPSSFFS